MAQTEQWDQPQETRAEDTATHGPILSPEEARQGVVSGRVRFLLAASLTLVVVAFAIVYAAHV
jgi:hypothetical protein